MPKPKNSLSDALRQAKAQEQHKLAQMMLAIKTEAVRLGLKSDIQVPLTQSELDEGKKEIANKITKLDARNPDNYEKIKKLHAKYRLYTKVETMLQKSPKKSLTQSLDNIRTQVARGIQSLSPKSRSSSNNRGQEGPSMGM